MMDAVNNVIVQISDVVWNYLLLFLLVGTGIFFTIRTRFVQVRRFKTAWMRVFGGFSLKGKKAGKDGMSSFQALATAIAAQVGTGNIAGCATALVSGGPGAIFWMWLAAFFGMATIYGEAVLAQKSKQRDENGEVVGGPVYYITHVFKGKFGRFLAVFFAIAVILALGFMGNMVQSNSISDAFYTAFTIPKWIMGLVVALLAAFIFLGGIPNRFFYGESGACHGGSLSHRRPYRADPEYRKTSLCGSFHLHRSLLSQGFGWLRSRHDGPHGYALWCSERPLFQ